MKIAVLIPCYNESLTVAKVVKDYKEAFPTADIYVQTSMYTIIIPRMEQIKLLEKQVL